MKVSATFNGSVVQIADIDVNGCQIYVTYVDASSNLIVDKVFYPQSATTIATGATIVS